MSTMTTEDLKKYIRDIPDFPKEGIIFKDITTLLSDKDAFQQAVEALSAPYQDKDIDYVIGVEARGFIFGAAVAQVLGAGFVPVRKKGKLPYKTQSVTYDLEYGTDTLEVHEDGVPAGSKVIIVDDLLATGGTVEAVAQLVASQKADIIGLAFLVELTFLNGKDKLKDHNVYSVLQY